MRRRIVIAIVVVAAALVLIFSGAFDSVTDTDQAKRLLNESGPWGPLAFVTLFVAVHCVALPVVPLMVAGTAVWDRATALPLFWAASMGAATAAFFVARALGSEWAARRMPERARKFEQRLAERGLLTLIVARVFLFLFPPLDWLCGVSPDFRVRDFLFGTGIGIIPAVVFWVIVGDEGPRLVGDNPLIAGVVAAVGLTVFLTVRRRRRSRLKTAS